MPRVATSHEINSQVATRGGMVGSGRIELVDGHVFVRSDDGTFTVVPVVKGDRQRGTVDTVCIGGIFVPTRDVPHIQTADRRMLVKAELFEECYIVSGYVRGYTHPDDDGRFGVQLRICSSDQELNPWALHYDVTVRMTQRVFRDYPPLDMKCAVVLRDGLIRVLAVQVRGTANPWFLSR